MSVSKVDSPAPHSQPMDAVQYENTAAAPPELAVQIERFPRGRYIEEIRALSQVNGWRSSLLIAINWTVIFAAAWAAVAIGHWAAYLAAMVVIGTRQYALGILLHDGAHYLLYRNRTVNDIVCDLFCAFPVSLSTTLYRESHFRHHRFTMTEDDPDRQEMSQDDDMWVWPKSKLHLAWVIVKCLFGLNIHRGLKFFLKNNPMWHMFSPITPAYPLRARLLYVAATIVVYGAVIGSGMVVPALILYGIPSVTILSTIIRFRAIAEHLQTEGRHELNCTRTVIPTWYEKLFFAPHGVNYHIEHHLFPSVPGPNLARLHDLMMQDEDYRAKAHLTRSYTGFVAELLAPKRSS